MISFIVMIYGAWLILTSGSYYRTYYEDRPPYNTRLWMGAIVFGIGVVLYMIGMVGIL